MRSFTVVGRRQPTEVEANPAAVRMQIFARDEVQAKSRFWYFMKRITKAKAAAGEILSITENREGKNTVAKNFRIAISFQSRTGIHYMTKEYRAVSEIQAVEKLYAEMGGSHRARFNNLQIISVSCLKAEELRNSTPFARADVAFPRVVRAKKNATTHKATFIGQNPNVFA